MGDKKLYLKLLVKDLGLEEANYKKLGLENEDWNEDLISKAQKWATDGLLVGEVTEHHPLPLVFDIAKRRDNERKIRAYNPSKLELTTFNGSQDQDLDWDFMKAKQANASLFLDETYKSNFDNLKEEFLQEFNDLDFSGTEEYKAFTLQHLIQKFFWNVGVGEQSNLISHYEYNRLTAAFAYCLSFENPSNEQTPLQIVSIDLGGIQKFIYNISSNKAARSLKGRSFYVQALLNSVAKAFLQKTQGFWGQIIYSAGGKFHVLLPFTEEINNQLVDFRKELEMDLWSKHREKLQLNFGRCAFGYDNGGHLIINKNLSQDKEEIAKAEEGLKDLWKALAESVEKSKYQAFQSIIKAEMNQEETKGHHNQSGLRWATLFSPNPIPKDAKTCEVTGELVEENKLEKLDKNEKKEGTAMVLPFVVEQANLGRRLTEASGVLYNQGKEIPTVKLGESEEKVFLPDNHDDLKDAGLFQSMNHTSFETLKKQSGEFGLGYTFYGGNLSPKFNGNEATFEEIVGSKEGEFNRLGVLRMDMDNLGALFQDGFNENTRHFAAYSTLSFRLDLFFAGFINALRNSNTYKDRIKIIYSGGDDVFAVGRWDKCINFAYDLNEAFKDYVGGNHITLSAGVAIVRPKFPIAKAAELAGEEEKKAKDHTYPKTESGKTKNSISFFEMPLSWKDEFPFVLEMKNELVKAIEAKEDGKKPLPHALLRHLMAWGEAAKEGEISWNWMSAYQLGRMAQQYKEQDEEGKKKPHRLLERLKALLFANEDFNDKEKFKKVKENSMYKAPELLAMAARWAELELRTNG